jgi:hypothetical protein
MRDGEEFGDDKRAWLPDRSLSGLALHWRYAAASEILFSSNLLKTLVSPVGIEPTTL